MNRNEIPEDLEWLARNISEWRHDGLGLITRKEGYPRGVAWAAMAVDEGYFTRYQWLQARQELGLDKTGDDAMSNEQWSEWISNRAGMCPVPPGTHIEYEMAKHGVATSKNPERLRWSITGNQWSDIIAYRYRLDNTETPEEKEELDRIEAGQVAKHSKYHREIKPGVWVDVYDVLHAWRVQNPALQHLIKKALQPGERGHKTREQDMKDIVASALRAGELGE